MNLVLGLISILRLAVLLVLIVRIAGRRIPITTVFAWSILGLAIVAVGASALLGDSYSVDARIFWTAGRAVWEGRDPYAHPEFVHPPQALPLFALLSLAPLPVFIASWAFLGLLGYGGRNPIFTNALAQPSLRFTRRRGGEAADIIYSGTFQYEELTIGYIRIPN